MTKTKEVESLSAEIEKTKTIIRELWGIVKLNRDTVADLLEEKKTQNMEIREVKNQLCDLRSMTDKLLNRVNDLEQNLKVKMDKQVHKTNKNEHKEQVKPVQKRTKISESDEKDNCKQIKNCEMRKAKKFIGKNIVIHGIRKEKNVSDEKWFLDFCEENLKVTPKIEKGYIKRTKAGHFIGIFTLKSQIEKAKIFKNCNKLKNSIWKISIRDDIYEVNQIGALDRGSTTEVQENKELTKHSNLAVNKRITANTAQPEFQVEYRQLLNRKLFNSVMAMRRKQQTSSTNTMDSDDEM